MLGAARYYNLFDFYCAAYGVTKIETVAEEYVCAVGVRPKAGSSFAGRGIEPVAGARVVLCWVGKHMFGHHSERFTRYAKLAKGPKQGGVQQ